MEDVLLRYFPEKQARAIEFCFEGGLGKFGREDLDDFWDEEDVRWFLEAAASHPTPASRLRFIAERIAAHGSFTPDLPLTT
jgi:hypothetical protein